jgi:hypothetical protein
MALLYDYSIADAQRVRDVRDSFTMQIAMANPVVMQLKKAPKPKSNIMEWPLKTYDTPKTTGVADGVDVGSSDYENNQSNRTMLANRYQRIWRVPSVSDESSDIEQYGVKVGTMEDNIMDKTMELWRDFEATIISDNEAVASSSGVASLMRGMARWISKADARFTDTATTPATAYRTPAANITVSKAASSNVSEDDLLNLMLNVSKARLTESDLLGICTPDMRLRADSFSRTDESVTTTKGAIYRFEQPDPEMVQFTVKRFNSSNGVLNLMTHYYMPLDASAALIHMLAIDTSKFELGTVRAPSFRELENRGGGRRGIVEAKFTLECLAPNAHGKIQAGATA